MSENVEKILSSDSNIVILNKSLNKEEKKEEAVAQKIPVTSELAAEPKVEAPAEVASTEANVTPQFDVPQVDLPNFEPAIPVEPINAFNPGFDVSAMPTYEEQVRQSEITSGETPVASVGNNFADAYNDVSLVTVQSTVVNEEDREAAKKAFMGAMEELYDKGPNNQIKTLMDVAAQMDQLLEEVDTQGFVSGPNHEAIKKVRLQYRGLQEVDNTKNFSDNQDIPNYGGMSY